jgi:hypothetical protein
MKAAVLSEINAPLEILDNIDIPSLSEGQVLVKIFYSGMCRSQLMEVTGGRGDDNYLPHHLPYHGARSQKAFLRRHYEGRLPDYIIKRKEKVGWHSPLEEWYDEGARDLLLSLFSGRRGPFVDWKKLETKIQKTREWPGKIIHLYASIAVLCDSYGIEA